MDFGLFDRVLTEWNLDSEILDSLSSILTCSAKI